MAPSLCNKITLFLANSYEVFLLALGLALSINKDDIISFIFQILMQVLLFYSMKEMGKYIKRQYFICLTLMIITIFVILYKYMRMNAITPLLTYSYYQEIRVSMLSWGFVFNVDANDDVSFDRFKSVSFEF